jgi:hypothetical protein
MRALALAVAALAVFATPASAIAYSSSDYYTNSSGHRVHRPERSQTPPAGATAHCRDGSWSFSQHHQGTCSHHGGVEAWR